MLRIVCEAIRKVQDNGLSSLRSKLKVCCCSVADLEHPPFGRALAVNVRNTVAKLPGQQMLKRASSLSTAVTLSSRIRAEGSCLMRSVAGSIAHLRLGR